MVSLSNIVVSFTGHLAYFPLMAEMHTPRDFRKSLVATSIFMTALYTLVALVIYYYAGPDVASPALSSADPTFARVAYGVAAPTIVVAGVIAGLLASKRIQEWVWTRKRGEPNSRDEASARAQWVSWVGIVAGLWATAFVIANVLPFFSELLAFIAALSGTWICLGIPGLTGLYMCHYGFDAADEDGDERAVARRSRARVMEERSGPWWRILVFPRRATRVVRGLWGVSLVTFGLAWVLVRIRVAFSFPPRLPPVLLADCGSAGWIRLVWKCAVHGGGERRWLLPVFLLVRSSPWRCA
jgi:hypothetical protein